MYAVIKTGGKQHKVQTGDQIRVELLEGKPGDKVTFQPLLVVDDAGKTHVGKEAGSSTVTARLLGETKGEKVRIFKYKPKTGYARHQGHRQQLTLLEIEDVDLKKKPVPKKTEKKADDDKPEKKASEKTSEKAD
ncbi:MAG: 50S ribosomal protein L21 [Actinomycetota bacterium]